MALDVMNELMFEYYEHRRLFFVQRSQTIFYYSLLDIYSGPVQIVEKFGTFHGAFHGTFFSRNFSPNSVFIVKKSRSFHGAFHRTFLAPDFSPNRIYSQKYRAFHGTFHRTFHQTSALLFSRSF